MFIKPQFRPVIQDPFQGFDKQVFFGKESVVASGYPTRNLGARWAEQQATLNPPVVPTVSEAIALPCAQSRHFPCALYLDVVLSAMCHQNALQTSSHHAQKTAGLRSRG